MGLKKELRNATTAWQFLTRLPVPGFWLRLLSEEVPLSFQRTAPYMPLVGLVLGALLWGADWLFRLFFPPLLESLLLVLWLVFLTGGLHLDGLMDTADGLGSHRPREETLKIMKDSHVGAKGVLAVLSLLLLKWVGLSEVVIDRGSLLWLMPLAGRMAMCGALLFWPDAREGQGLGSQFHPVERKWLISFALIFSFAVSWLIGGIFGLLAVLLAVLTGWLMADAISRRLKGLTGDVYGAVNEVVEVAMIYLYLIPTLL